MKMIRIFSLLITICIYSYVVLNAQLQNNVSNGFNGYVIKNLNKTGYEPLNVDKIAKATNFTKYFLNSESYKIIGVIGKEAQRIKVKINSAEQSKTSPVTYILSGKTNVNGNISDFKGNLVLQDIYDFKEKQTGHELIICRFETELKETGTGAHSGTFKGNYYIILSRVVEEIRFAKVYPMYLKNHSFAGEWKSYDGKLSSPVIWGEDYSYEDLSEFLTGISKITIDEDKTIEKYWKNYFDAYTEGTPKNIRDKAMKAEKDEWWK